MWMRKLIMFAVVCQGWSQLPLANAAGPSGTVTVRVFKGRDVSPDKCTPVPDVVVVAHAPDGTALATVRTNPDGEATFSDFPSGGAVTVVEPHTEARSLRTVFGVQPGDVIDVPVEETTRTLKGWLSVDWKAYPGAATYQYFDGCNEAILTTRHTHYFKVDDRCVSPWNSISAVLYAENERGTPLAYAVATGVSLERTDVTHVPVRWRTDFVDLSLRITAPPGASELAVWLRRFDGTGSHSSTIPFPQKRVSLRIPSAFFDEVVVRRTGGNYRITRSAPLIRGKTQVAVDLATPAPSEIEPFAIEPSSAPRPTVRLRAHGPGVDMLAGKVIWANVRWSFVAGPDTTTVCFPHLPEELAGYAPSGAPTAIFSAVHHSHFTSWNEVRRQLRWSLAFGDQADLDVVDLGGFIALASAGGL